MTSIEQGAGKTMHENGDLDGNAPDESEIALLLIDVINDLEFEGGEDLFQNALPAAKNIARLKGRAQQARVPVIYVNDNFGKWRSDFKRIITHCLQNNVRGRPIAELLQPVDLLLECLGARTLVLTGIAGNNCVLFTANDAYLRDYKLIVPADCTASIYKKDNDNALHQMQQVLKADIRQSAEVDFAPRSREAEERTKAA